MLALRFTKQAQKTLRKMPSGIATRMRAELGTIAVDPSAYRGDWKPLKGSGLWRLRVGDWRAICDLSSGELVLLVVKIGPRGDVYQ
ncbi:type II toxin-antitoxin system RelE family toxin [Thiocystis violacea]|uniref:type II toxin-antitoxin system RelE family toxin n=1 Tax=Thiocystis violacea TaxID=13725 RepID=UPI00190424F6|nr:type II toxin-antitoxin system RelE/ParE family toxin [Thiocystis violacea]MBK1720975.1 plasmid stabilization protein [Thiocystis violacea]